MEQLTNICPNSRGPAAQQPQIHPFREPGFGAPRLRVTPQKKNMLIGGQVIVELLVAFGLASILLPAILTGFASSSGGKVQEQQRLKATGYLKEGIEAVRSVREANWANVANNNTYHLVANGSVWTIQPGSETLGDFTRSIAISDLTPPDPSLKQVTVTVTWNNIIQTSISAITYLARLTNLAWIQTTVADFTGVSPNTSTLTNTQITNNSGGEVQLANGVGGWGDWCNPNLTINGLDLTRQSVPTAVSAIYGHAYTANGVNASGNSLDSINISDPPAPTAPVATEANSYNNFKSSGIYADPATSLVYLTTNHPGLTVDIVSTSTFNQVSTFSDSGGENGQSVFVNGGIGYVTAQNTNGSSPHLYTFDTTKTPAKELSKISLAAKGNKVVVVGQYAYVVTSSTTAQLQIFDVSDPTNIKSVTGGSINVGNGAGGMDISIDTTTLTAYLVTSYVSSSVPDIFVIDLTGKTVTRSLNSGGMNPMGVAFVPGGWLIVVGDSAPQYQVFDLTKAQTTPCGSLSNPTGAATVYTVSYIQEPDGDVFSYILTSNSSKEFQMIAGGPGGSGGRYFSSGTFESSTFSSPTGKDGVFNRFSAGLTPNGQTVSFQFAGAHMINGSCNGVTFTYVSVPGTYGALPLSSASSGYVNPAGCFRYKATFYTNDVTKSPVLNDMTVNYSP